jgi:hypothetical protein
LLALIAWLVDWVMTGGHGDMVAVAVGVALGVGAQERSRIDTLLEP